MDAVADQAVHVRRLPLQPGVAQSADEVVAVIVGENKDDVARPGTLEQERGRCGRELTAGEHCFPEYR